MKRITLILMFLACFIQCTTEKPEIITSTIVNREDLFDYALSVRNDFYPKLMTKSSWNNSQQYLYANEEMDTSATVIDFGDNEGFVVLSNDNNTPLVIAGEGSFEEYMDNPGMRVLMIESLSQQTGFDPSVPTSLLTIPTSIITDTLVAPMVSVRWHQGAPFGIFAPNYLAGCTPIAIAQVMAYYQYPNELSLTYPNVAIQQITLDWENLTSHTGYHGNTCDICLQCAYLARQIGHICEASYGSGGTGAWPEVVYLNSLGYSGIQYDDYSFSSIIGSLNKQYPCIISGFNNNSGHTWVIDGYYEKTTISNIFMVAGLDRELFMVTKDIDTYMHFNYGWGSGSDIFVLSNRIRHSSHEPFTGDGDNITNPITMFNDRYNDVQMLVTEVKPMKE
ncbi:MAG: hypothetical protein E7112_01400 [Bacteroidales bacterium]|nr:hypothetical protein [Bacteroidales bacterium]